MGRNSLEERSLDDLIKLHTDLLDKTPFWQRKTKDRLKHALLDFNLWSRLETKSDNIFKQYSEDNKKD